jgi:methyltransferase
MAWVLTVMGAVALLRLAELWVSRRRLAEDLAQGRAAPIPEPAYAAMVAVHVAWLAGCVLEPWLARRDFRPEVAVPALLSGAPPWRCGSG